MQGKGKLIVIDDEPDIAELARVLAEQAGFDAVAASTPESFRRHYADGADVVVLDLFMPMLDGIEVIRILAESGRNPTLILMSGFDTRVLDTSRELAEAHGLTVAGTLTKPIRIGELRRMLGTIGPRRRAFASASAQPIGADDLRRAIDRDEIVVHFQPKMTIPDRALVGAEALVRWRHPDLGLIPPDSFVPLAEASGLIDDLTVVVIDQALSACRAGRIVGSVSVNMSVQSLSSLDLPERILSKLDIYSQTPERLVVEVTESGLMQDETKALDVLARLRLKGIGLSIDDFGTGYSSLKQLRRVPFGELKIDRSFVDGIDSDPSNRAIVQASVEMGHNLAMKVVAEGIETESQWSALAALGCDMAQGYLIGRPLPIEDFPARSAAA